MHHTLICFVEIKAGVRAYSVSAVIDKISLHILQNSYKPVYSYGWMSNVALAGWHSPRTTDGCSDAKANGAVK